VNGCLKPWGDVRHVSLPSHLSEETRGDINTSHHGRKQQLFEIDEELEARFDAATQEQEQEQTDTISEETKQSCLDLFAELGKRVDCIARYVRATEYKAKGRQGRGDEADCSTEGGGKPPKTESSKSRACLPSSCACAGLKRVEGELNSIRLQKNGQGSLQVDLLSLPAEYNQLTIALAQPDWARVLQSIASPELNKQ